MEEEKQTDDVSYEEWVRANRFARVRYKYGLIVLILCWICLALLIFYVWHYSTELATHPGIYAVKSLGVDYCYCYGEVNYYINSSTISYASDVFG